jgi:hypothetical protein
MLDQSSRRGEKKVCGHDHFLQIDWEKLGDNKRHPKQGILFPSKLAFGIPLK